jgi:hypothetical protein
VVFQSISLAKIQKIKLLGGSSDRLWFKHLPERKYPHADKEWIWQHVFPASGMTRDPRTDLVRRYHLHESGVQKTLKQAVRCLLSEAPCGNYEASRMSHFSALLCNPSA